MDNSSLKKIKELHEILVAEDALIRKNADSLAPVVRQVAKAIRCLSAADSCPKDCIESALDSLKQVSSIIGDEKVSSILNE